MSVVVNYYQEKTRSILRKYGPGPRVHYHMGVLADDVTPALNQALLQRQLTQSQDDMMATAAAFWDVPHMKGKRILDVGAGLGGASLWMAQHKQATVHSLVQFGDHAQIIRSFAKLTGLSKQVTPVQGDAHTYTPIDQQPYDAIMALESPCYFDRHAWFRHLDTILAPGGTIWVEDALLGPNPPADARPVFDKYWKTRVGSASDYLEAAEAAGFEGRHLDLTDQTAAFWKLSAAWIEHELQRTRRESVRQKLQRSYDSAMFHYDYWCKHHYQIGLFAFSRKNEA